MVRERSISRYMSTAVDSAGLIVTFSKVGFPSYNELYSVVRILIVTQYLKEFF